MNLRSLLSAAMSVMMAFGLLFASTAFAAEPQPWQLGLQDPAGSIAEKATSLHNMLLIIITGYLFVCAGVAGVCLCAFSPFCKPQPIKNIA
jgi:cytochrome c oxidase subunit 2